MPLLSKELREKYIDDLMRKRPAGPYGRKVSYTIESDYDYDKHKYINTPVPSDPQWGYTDQEIYSLGLYTSDDVSEYVLSRWFNNKSTWQLGRQKATYTRRVNRLWEQRLRPAIERIRKEGGSGIYAVATNRYYRNHDVLGHIYAQDKEEALRFANMFFAYLIDSGSHQRIVVDFKRFGKPEEVVVFNAQTIQNAASTISKYKEQITELHGLIEKQNLYLETLKMVEAQQLSSEEVHCKD